MKKLKNQTIEKIKDNKILKIKLQNLLLISERTLYRRLELNHDCFTSLSCLLLIANNLNEKDYNNLIEGGEA